MNDFILTFGNLNYNQEQILSFIVKNNLSIIKKNRQVGSSSLIELFLSEKLVNDKENCNVVFVAHSKESEMFIMENFHRQIDRLLTQQKAYLTYTKNTKSWFTLSNGNTLKFIRKPEDLCSERFNFIIFDEAAYIKNATEIFRVANHQINSKKIIVSNQNGIDDFFAPLYLLGDKIGANVLNCSYKDDERMVKTLSDDNIKRIINGKRFNSEFGDSFLIDEYDELDLNDFSQKINVWADYYRVKFTTVDFIELINNKTIQINKKQIELCL